MFINVNASIDVRIGETKNDSDGEKKAFTFAETSEISSCQVTFRKNNNGEIILYVDSTKEDISKDSFTCQNDIKIEMEKSLINGIKNLDNLVPTCDSTLKKCIFSGIIADDKQDTIICSNDKYTLILDKEKDYRCSIKIETDINGEITMTYGKKTLTTYNNTTISNGPYTCESDVIGYSTTFYLSKSLKKDSIKKNSDCPLIESTDKNITTVNDNSSTNIEEDTKNENFADGTLGDLISKFPGNKNLNGISPSDITDCTKIINETLSKYLTKIFSLMKYAGIVLCIGLTIYDFVKVLLDSDKNALNKITKKALTRLILIAVLFFLPTLVNFLISIFVDNPCKINF